MSALKNGPLPKSVNGFIKLLLFTFLMIFSGFVMAKRPGGGNTPPTLTITDAVFIPEDIGGTLKVWASLSGVKGKSRRTYTLFSDAHVQISNKSTKDKQYTFEIELGGSDPVPCNVYVTVDNPSLTSTIASVRDCPVTGNNNPPTCTINSPVDGQVFTLGAGGIVNVNFSATAVDNENDALSLDGSFQNGTPATASTSGNGDVILAQSVVFDSAGPKVLNFTADETATSELFTCNNSITITIQEAGPGPDVSINSTSQNNSTIPAVAVPEQPVLINQADYQILAVNDLGMHCGDLDTRVASILPAFNVAHAMVIRKGSEPEILDDTEVDVYYSAASNPVDPAVNPANPPPEFVASGPSVYKTNFWGTVNNGVYDPFYPPVVTPLSIPLDLGLPVPDLAFLYPASGSPSLVADQQAMPGMGNPYNENVPQLFKRFDTDLPFFIDFPFGYLLTDMDWFAADGIPFTTFDDFGRLNSYPLLRVQAVTKGGDPTNPAHQLATIDPVIPVSGEADCKGCHADVSNGGNGSATIGKGFTVITADQDPEYLFVPEAVSIEWAADINILRLHDHNETTSLATPTISSTDPTPASPIVCQTCHYTPALDLANFGPLGPESQFPGDTAANGREQRIHKTMSRVMHDYHGTFITAQMPLPTDSARDTNGDGYPEINAAVMDTLNETCYQCHPGKNTQCLRGAMFNGGMVCQDCHGGMEQVGDDFSGGLAVATPFPNGADLTKRVPWAHEPACMSCHTGDALDNMNGDANVISSPDGIRLLQAYQSNDATATPIVATNRRFAEDVVDGKQVLYRLSKGHEGVFCEACHGSTHSIWPNVNPNSNDNVASNQLQGHSGLISECSTCHGDNAFSISDFEELENGQMKGPRGMHPVNDPMWNEKHKEVDKPGRNSCRTCHGQDGLGTVLSRTFTERTLDCEVDSNANGCDNKKITVEKGTEIGCDLCHQNFINKQ